MFIILLFVWQKFKNSRDKICFLCSYLTRRNFFVKIHWKRLLSCQNISYWYKCYMYIIFAFHARYLREVHEVLKYDLPESKLPHYSCRSLGNKRIIHFVNINPMEFFFGHRMFASRCKLSLTTFCYICFMYSILIICIFCSPEIFI